jgi:hypothetical protein
MIKEDSIENILKADSIDVGGNIKDSKVNLVLYERNNGIDINEITFLIDCEPTEAHRKGDIYKPGGKAIIAKIGLWKLAAPDELDFVEKIKHLLNKTTKNKNVWEKLLKNYDIQLRCAIFLHSWTEGFDWEIEIIKEIANRCWKFGLSIYSAEGDEIVDAFLRNNIK